MQRAVLLIAFLLAGFVSQAQVLTGQVKSRSTDSTLVDATVLLLDSQDSTMLSFAKTKENGQFEMRGTKHDEVILQVSYVGFENFYLLFYPTGEDQNLGIIFMEESSRELEEVFIIGERASMEIKNDTVEYNAGSYKVQDNAVAEDLLKRLPGVEVDRDGSITAQGKEVQRVLVDGKEFFGRDPKMATRNIPADAIEKVQVYDKQSDMAEFTGIDDGMEETTIDLRLRADKKNLGFGKISTGVGADADKLARYNVAGNYSQFKNGNQLSFVGNANNVNEQPFGTGGFGGGGGVRFRGGSFGGTRSGLMRNLSGGINFNSDPGLRTEVNGSYSYTNNNTNVLTDGTSESVIGNLETFGNSFSDRNTDSESHRVNVTLNNNINEQNKIRWVNRFDYSDNASNSINNDEQYLSGTDQMRNSTERTNLSEGSSLGFSSQALYQKAFDKRGRSFTTNLNFSLNNGKTDGTLLSRNGLFDAGLNDIAYTLLNQVNNQTNDNMTLGAEVSYTEPLNMNNFLEFNYSFRKVNNELDKRVYNVEETGNIFDTDLSNQYKNDYTYNRAGINYRIAYDKLTGNLGASLQNSNLHGDLILRNQIIEKTYNNPVFNGRLRYSFTTSKSMDVSYNTNIREPSMTQLSPIPDNSNPLNIFIGNPDLKPQYAQRMNVNFRNFNQLTFRSFFMSAGLNYTTDNITNLVEYDEVTLAQTRTPINYGNNVGVNAMANYGFRIRPISTRFSISTFDNISRSQTLINNIDNITNTFMSTNTLRADITPGDNFNLSLSARVSFNHTTYSQNTQLNPNYINQGYTADLEWIFPGILSLTSAMDYSVFRYATTADVQKVPLWNASVFRTIFNNKRGEIRFSINDILGKNTVISQTASGNSFTEQRTNALGRYFLLSFTYNINGGAPAGGGMGGRPRMR